MAKESISELGAGSIENMPAEEEYREKRKKKNEENLRKMWDIIKCTNIPEMKILGDKEKKRKNMAENFKIFWKH